MLTRLELADRYGDDILLLDPPEMFDECLLGVAERCGMEPVAVYSRARIVERFLLDGMTRDEAEEYIDFNVTGAYVGERTPLILDEL